MTQKTLRNSWPELNKIGAKDRRRIRKNELTFPCQVLVRRIDSSINVEELTSFEELFTLDSSPDVNQIELDQLLSAEQEA